MSKLLVVVLAGWAQNMSIHIEYYYEHKQHDVFQNFILISSPLIYNFIFIYVSVALAVSTIILYLLYFLHILISNWFVLILLYINEYYIEILATHFNSSSLPSYLSISVKLYNEIFLFIDIHLCTESEMYLDTILFDYITT